MLERLHVKNFKLLRDVEIEFERDHPTVFIGTNASGKSTVIEVLDFLQRCADDGLEDAVVAHGGMSAIRTIGVNAPLEITSSWTLTGVSDPGSLLVWQLALDATDHGQVLIRSEDLRMGDRVLVTTTSDGRRHVFGESDPSKPPSLVPEPRRLAFHSFADPTGYYWLGVLDGFCAGVRAYGSITTAPTWARSARDYASARDTVVLSTSSSVGRDGVGLANALYNIQVENHEAWSRLERAFRAEFPFVKRLVFPADPGGARISFAIDDVRFPGRRIFASEMSDGMIALLCLLTLVVNTWAVTVLALDEPDAQLHPSAVRRLLAFAAVKNPTRRLILVTHANALLDELVDPAASIRIVESTPTGARIRKLDPEALAAWRKDYSLSDLRRTGLLDPSNSDYGSNE